MIVMTSWRNLRCTSLLNEAIFTSLISKGEVKENKILICVINMYFLGFSRVVTLISLLAALKETCSPDSLHNY